MGHSVACHDRTPVFANVLLWVAILSGLCLSITSVLKICSSCSATAQYRVFGLDFGWFGIGYFVILATVVFFRADNFWADWLAVLLLFASAGAEVRFVWIQKYEIGQWCPICLSIAVTIFVACAAISYDMREKLISRGAVMKPKLLYIVFVILCFWLGLGTAWVGVRKEAEAAELNLFLGKASSPTTVYFISDWFCPSCRKIEPSIEKMYPELARMARISFIDLPIHKESLNFTPYNLQFIAFEKTKYISLRRALTALSLKTKNPTEAEVQEVVAPLGVKLRQVSYADTLYGMQSNLTIYRGYGVSATPSVVVANSKTKKSKVLVGDKQISEANIKAAIDEVGKK